MAHTEQLSLAITHPLTADTRAHGLSSPDFPSNSQDICQPGEPGFLGVPGSNRATPSDSSVSVEGKLAERIKQMNFFFWTLVTEASSDFPSKNVSTQTVCHNAFKVWIFFKLYNYPSQEMLGQDY